MAESNAGTDRDVRATESGIPVERVYDEASVADLDLAERLGEPGAFPFTRGIHPTMYRKRPMDDAASTQASRRPRRRTPASATCSRPARRGSRPAFDLPTQLGMDSDDTAGGRAR